MFLLKGDTQVIDVKDKGIFDLYLTKYWGITYATKAAISVLYVDKMLHGIQNIRNVNLHKILYQCNNTIFLWFTYLAPLNKQFKVNSFDNKSFQEMETLNQAQSI